MNKRVTDLIEAARRLTPAEQEELLARLPSELSEISPLPLTHAELVAVARERAADIDQGRVRMISWDDVLAEMKKS